MRQLFMVLAATAALTGTGATAAPSDIPAAVYADPAPDPAHPPHSAQVLIPSGGVGMNALFYLAGGAGPHPTLLLLHGLPGNEQNLDLAQAVRRAGWNVLTMHYRGSWGSPGTFSITHVMEDADAAIAFLHQPDIAARYGINTRRIFIGGHSMGGFATAAHAHKDPDLAGVILIDAWDAGLSGAQFARLYPESRDALAAKEFDDFGNSLNGATPQSIAADWDFMAWGPGLARHPLLVIGAAQALGPVDHALAQAVIKAGGNVTDIILPTDHSFSDHRIEMEADVVRWLEALPAR